MRGFGLSPDTSYRGTFLSIPGDSTGQASWGPSSSCAHHVGLKIITSKMEDWMQWFQWPFFGSIGTPILSHKNYLRCTSQPQKLLKIPGPGPFQQLKRCHVLRCASLCFRCCNESLLGDPFIPWAPAIDGVELKAHPLDLLIEEKAGATAGPIMEPSPFQDNLTACVTNIRMDLKMWACWTGRATSKPNFDANTYYCTSYTYIYI